MSRIGKSSINWKELEKLVPSDQKVFFFAFRGKSDAYLRRVLASPAEPPKIDWEFYKKLVPDPSMVDSLKSKYEAFKVPIPEDKYSKEVDAQWSKLEPEIQKFCATVQGEIDMAKKELDRINALPKFEEMTMEVVYDMHPDIALDSVNRPTFWPHTPEEQPAYRTPAQKDLKHLDLYKP